MARIRTIKPEFFRHEGLQDLEAANPGAYVMLTFAALFGHCDKGGVFQWKPRSLKLDILPFLNFDMEKTLRLLEAAGQLSSYEVDGQIYGEIASFSTHQRIGGKESQEPVKHPRRTGEAAGKQRGSTGEATGIAGREGKGREQEGKGTRARDPASIFDGVKFYREHIAETYPRHDLSDTDTMQAGRAIEILIGDELATPELLRENVAAFRAQQDAAGNTDTKFVKMPGKFFGTDGHWRGPFPLAKAKSTSTADKITWRPDAEEDARALGKS